MPQTDAAVPSRLLRAVLSSSNKLSRLPAVLDTLCALSGSTAEEASHWFEGTVSNAALDAAAETWLLERGYISKQQLRDGMVNSGVQMAASASLAAQGLSLSLPLRPHLLKAAMGEGSSGDGVPGATAALSASKAAPEGAAGAGALAGYLAEALPALTLQTALSGGKRYREDPADSTELLQQLTAEGSAAQQPSPSSAAALQQLGLSSGLPASAVAAAPSVKTQPLLIRSASLAGPSQLAWTAPLPLPSEDARTAALQLLRRVAAGSVAELGGKNASAAAASDSSFLQGCLSRQCLAGHSSSLASHEGDEDAGAALAGEGTTGAASAAPAKKKPGRKKKVIISAEEAAEAEHALGGESLSGGAAPAGRASADSSLPLFEVSPLLFDRQPYRCIATLQDGVAVGAASTASAGSAGKASLSSAGALLPSFVALASSSSAYSGPFADGEAAGVAPPAMGREAEIERNRATGLCDCRNPSCPYAATLRHAAATRRLLEESRAALSEGPFSFRYHQNSKLPGHWGGRPILLQRPALHFAVTAYLKQQRQQLPLAFSKFTTPEAVLATILSQHSLPMSSLTALCSDSFKVVSPLQLLRQTVVDSTTLSPALRSKTAAAALAAATAAAAAPARQRRKSKHQKEAVVVDAQPEAVVDVEAAAAAVEEEESSSSSSAASSSSSKASSAVPHLPLIPYWLVPVHLSISCRDNTGVEHNLQESFLWNIYDSSQQWIHPAAMAVEQSHASHSESAAGGAAAGGATVAGEGAALPGNRQLTGPAHFLRGLSRGVTPLQFATALVENRGLPLDLSAAIANSIQMQLDDFAASLTPDALELQHSLRAALDHAAGLATAGKGKGGSSKASVTTAGGAAASAATSVSSVNVKAKGKKSATASKEASGETEQKSQQVVLPTVVRLPNLLGLLAREGEKATSGTASAHFSSSSSSSSSAAAPSSSAVTSPSSSSQGIKRIRVSVSELMRTSNVPNAPAPEAAAVPSTLTHKQATLSDGPPSWQPLLHPTQLLQAWMDAPRIDLTVASAAAKKGGQISADVEGLFAAETASGATHAIPCLPLRIGLDVAAGEERLLELVSIDLLGYSRLQKRIAEAANALATGSAAGTAAGSYAATTLPDGQSWLREDPVLLAAEKVLQKHKLDRALFAGPLAIALQTAVNKAFSCMARWHFACIEPLFQNSEAATSEGTQGTGLSAVPGSSIAGQSLRSYRADELLQSAGGSKSSHDLPATAGTLQVVPRPALPTHLQGLISGGSYFLHRGVKVPCSAKEAAEAAAQELNRLQPTLPSVLGERLRGVAYSDPLASISYLSMPADMAGQGSAALERALAEATRKKGALPIITGGDALSFKPLPVPVVPILPYETSQYFPFQPSDEHVMFARQRLLMDPQSSSAGGVIAAGGSAAGAPGAAAAAGGAERGSTAAAAEDDADMPISEEAQAEIAALKGPARAELEASMRGCGQQWRGQLRKDIQARTLPSTGALPVLQLLAAHAAGLQQ